MCVEDSNYLKFESLTLCPYDRNLIDIKLLTKDDIDFINKYHERCWQTLSPLLEGDNLGKEWLRAYTLPL
jgi:Xaa-Pro aminopeptidase